MSNSSHEEVYMNGNLDIYQSAGQNTGWIRFFGIIQIIMGVLSILSCIGLLYGWLFIWAGAILMKASNAGEQASVSRSETALVEYHSHVQKFFKLMSIALIITLIVSIIIVVVYFLFFAALSFSALFESTG